jgi:hypothetical protein
MARPGQLLGYDSQHGVAPDPSVVASWVDQMRAGLSRRQLTIDLCTGSEFWTLSGQTNTGYVQRLYQTLLQRSADQDGLNYWVGQLNGGMTRADVAARFIDGDEFHGIFIDDDYLALDDRPSDGDGWTYWVSQMRSGMSQEEVIRRFLEAPEFWTKAVHAGYARHSVTPYYVASISGPTYASTRPSPSSCRSLVHRQG